MFPRLVLEAGAHLHAETLQELKYTNQSREKSEGKSAKTNASNVRKGLLCRLIPVLLVFSVAELDIVFSSWRRNIKLSYSYSKADV